jgi:2-dehydro-3-deoxyphosphogluconate aldolase/(4S)-4-hydroxy-2-oxoglutarate aldolase
MTKGTAAPGFEEILGSCRVMAILRGFTVERTVELATVAWDLGITCVEVPVQSAQSAEALAATVRAAGSRDVWVGAGTVITAERVAAAAAAGAQFTVAPGLDPQVASTSAWAGLPHLPGVSTPSDIQRALAKGLTWLKAFPASVLTPQWVTAMHGPFPDASFVATGGIDATNASEFLAAGCRAVAVGSALTSPAALPALAALLTH